MSRSTFLFARAALVAAAAFLVVACSSDDASDDASDEPAEQTSPSSAVPLSGDPVRIGFVDIEGDLNIDSTPQREAAQDLVQHLNEEGGIDGHPIELVTCVTQGASGGAECANQMVQDGVVLVLGLGIIDSAPMYPILKSAGIPLLGAGASPLNAADLTPDDNHWFLAGGALVRFSMVNRFVIDELGADSVGLIVGSSSAAQQAAQTFIKAPLEAEGVSVASVQVAESNPDYTAVVNAIMESDVLQVLLGCAGQDEAIKQAVALGYSGAIFGCIDPVDLEAMGSAVNGVYSMVSQTPLTDPAFSDDPDVVAYTELAEEYGWDLSATTAQVYSQVLVAKALIEEAGGATATGEQVRDVLAATTNMPIPLGSPAGLTCSTPQSPLAPTACNVEGMFVQVQDDQTVQAVAGTWVSPPSPS